MTSIPLLDSCRQNSFRNHCGSRSFFSRLSKVCTSPVCHLPHVRNIFWIYVCPCRIEPFRRQLRDPVVERLDVRFDILRSVYWSISTLYYAQGDLLPVAYPPVGLVPARLARTLS